MKITNKKMIHEGIIINAYSADVIADSGSFPVEVFEHPGAVAIAASTNGKDFFLVNQFRFGLNSDLIEFPAGKIDDPFEDPILAAHRELQEETGYKAATMVPLGVIHPAGAYIDEVIHLYYAQDLEYVGQNLDEHEALDVRSYTLDTLEDMIYNDDITDAKTISLVFKVKNYLNLK